MDLFTKTERMIKLMNKYKELKSLEYSPYPYQLEAHKATNNIVFLQAANQIGKSYTASQEVVFWFRGYHPYKKLNKTTGLTIWVCSVTHALAVESMYEAKLKRILPANEYRELREAGTLFGLEHKITKNRIYFKSYAKGSDRLQSVPVDLVVIDEQPAWEEFDELRTRIKATRRITKQSQMYVTFTPLKVDKTLRDFLLQPLSDEFKRIKVTSYDCPLFSREEIDKEKELLPERSFKIRHLGEWASYDGALIHSFNDSCVVNYEELKPNPFWKSVLCVDPAPSGYTGISIISQDPENKKWYIVKEAMPKDLDPDALVLYCEDLANGYNIYDRFCDIHESWFIKTARQLGFNYLGVSKKKKEEMVTDLDTSFSRGNLFCCDNCNMFIEQTTSYANKEGHNEFAPIKGDFHILDSVVYGNMRIFDIQDKKPEPPKRDRLWDAIDKQFFNAKKKSIFSYSK